MRSSRDAGGHMARVNASGLINLIAPSTMLTIDQPKLTS
jgi:hypothetical protein